MMIGKWFELAKPMKIDGRLWDEVCVLVDPAEGPWPVVPVVVEPGADGRPVAVAGRGSRRRVLGRVHSWGMGAELIRLRMLQVLERRRPKQRKG